MGHFEEYVLRAVLHLKDNAYGVTIKTYIDELTDKDTSFGAIYSTLERLEAKGFLSSYLGDPIPQRGGRAKRFYRLEAAGRNALQHLDETRRRIGLRELAT